MNGGRNNPKILTRFVLTELRRRGESNDIAIMVHVDTIDLFPRSEILLNPYVGMFIDQPHRPQTPLDATESYHSSEQAKPQQMAVLTKTFAVARSAPRQGTRVTQCTVLFDYSIPVLDWFALSESALRTDDWPKGTVAIGGIDALTKPLYAQILHGDATHVGADRHGRVLVRPDQYCAVTWVKGEDGKPLSTEFSPSYILLGRR